MWYVSFLEKPDIMNIAISANHVHLDYHLIKLNQLLTTKHWILYIFRV